MFTGRIEDIYYTSDRRMDIFVYIRWTYLNIIFSVNTNNFFSTLGSHIKPRSTRPNQNGKNYN
jgi:hypothetical protein